MNNSHIIFIIILLFVFQSCSLFTEPKDKEIYKIVFMEEINGNGDIFTINSDGTELKNLTNSNENESSPSFTPDGHKIVFMMNEDIYSINVDGTNRRNLSNSSSLDYDYSISPDGTRIIFLSTRNNPSYNSPGSEVYIMDIDGTNQTRLTNKLYSNYEPTFSPDGLKIVYTTYLDSLHISIVSMMNIDGTDNKIISPLDMSFSAPTFSESINKICLYSSRDGLYLINPDGTNLSKLVNGGFYPRFSNSSSTIFYNSVENEKVNLVRINYDGTDKLSLNNGQMVGGQFDISQDDEKIVYVKIEDNIRQIYLMNSDGSGQKKIYNSPNNCWHPSFKY